MGVLGLTSLLQQHGWMPKRRDCTTPLWRDSVLDGDLADHVQLISSGSTLAVDGNGLAFYLHDVAYSRYFTKVTGHAKSVKGSDTAECSCQKNISKDAVIQCLPQSMPLHALDEVTREFVLELKKSHLTLVIYWDGPDRRMKAATTTKRSGERDDEWGNLYQFCQFGILPFQSPCLQNFSKSFPRSRLMMQQVISTLHSFSDVKHIDCDEEADREVAMASANDPNTFCVGMDSDFCLFRDTKYVPLSTLNATGSHVTGSVITRDNLAELFNLPESESMVELGILMGNDYVGNAKEAQLDYSGSTVEDAIDFLQLQEKDYQVRSSCSAVQSAIDFTRALYSFRPLDAFPIDEKRDRGGDRNLDDSVDDTDDTEGQRPMLPDLLDLSLTTLKPTDFSLKAAVLRTMQAYIDQSVEEDPIISQQQLDTFSELSQALELKLNKRSLLSDRPTWEDVQAAYVIEKCIYFAMIRNQKSPVVKYSSPMKLFDHLSFDCMMNATRTSPKTIEPSQTIPSEPDTPAPRQTLPIDEFEDEIVHSVNTQRVTIIHGETGCGKSSRVPIMLLRAPPPGEGLKDVRMFISQPRRIAAKSLVERVRSTEPELRHKIALRMGHGEREYETNQTRAWFVTTGYLVRLLANFPQRFNDVSHLVIDEVHERSVDSDVLCLLCRRLLLTNHNIRLVLMSATLAANMYADYFGVPQEPIQVGGRRFPIKEFFIEDIVSTFKFPPKDQKHAKIVRDQCEKTRCRAPPSNTYMESLYQLAVRVTVAVGQAGSSVLIFVTGMNDIVSIIDLVEKQYMPGVRYTCFPIHSDVPFEEQMAAFDKPAPDEIKIIIGTNAAESSITLPDVDHVVCLGLQKQIVYNAASHRQLLTPAWISRANAIQRAGRTGRVRKGNVYRLYTRRALDEYMHKFEIGEMLRVPLDSVILELKEMLHDEAATDVLLDCLEPPDLLTIERSFESLHTQNFLSEADDNGVITMLGSFVARLGIDLMLGSLIGLGIQFGVGPEAIELAAILSFDKTPWMISNPLFHETWDFNDKTSRTFMSRCHFDANLYSDPLAIMNLLWDYENIGNKKSFAWEFGLALPRVRRLLSTRNSIRERVMEFIGGRIESFAIRAPPSRMPHSKVVILRIIQVWVFHDNLIQSFQLANASGDSVAVTLRKNLITSAHLEQIVDPKRHEFKLVTHQEIEQKGKFTPVGESFTESSFLPIFEKHLISYCAENDFYMAWYRVDSSSLILLVRDVVAESTSLVQMKEEVLSDSEESEIVVSQHMDGNLRGRNGRACGLWTPEGSNGTSVRYVKYVTTQKEKINKLAKFLKIKSLQTAHVEKTLSCLFLVQNAKKKKGNVSPGFSLFSRGQCSQIVKQDVIDLFSTTSENLQMSSRESGKPTQEVQFKLRDNVPLPYPGKSKTSLSGSVTDMSTSWKNPILRDIPEGARIMSVIASSRRPEHYILFSSLKPTDDDKSTIKVEMSRTESRISDRWISFHSQRPVYVEVNSVPAAALSLDSPIEVFAVAGDSLELKGGGLRVSGLTLLPPGRLFLLLSMKTFGLHPGSKSYGDEDEELDQCFEFLDAMSDKTGSRYDASEAAERVIKAIEFNDSCNNLGERLICYPDLVEKLLSIFDGVDGYPCGPWEDLGDEVPNDMDAGAPPVSKRGIRRKKAFESSPASQIAEEVVHPPPPTIESKKGKKKKKSNGNNQAPDTSESQDAEYVLPKNPAAEKKTVEPELVSKFNKKARQNTKTLFALDGTDVGDSDLPSTNILSLLVDTYRKESKKSDLMVPSAASNTVPAQWARWAELADSGAPQRQDEAVALVPSQWQVYRMTGGNSKVWYAATFIGSTIPFISRQESQQFPSWMKNSPYRPSKSKEAMQCIPPHVAPRLTYWQAKVVIDEKATEMVMYPTLELALRMGAAYWMERQFYDGRRHWYQIPFPEMVELVQSSS